MVYLACVDRVPSPLEEESQTATLAAAAHAIGALDGALAASPVARFWHERASIVGLAQCLALAGVTLTPAEFFRGAVGLVEPAFMVDIDRSLVTAIVTEWHLVLARTSFTAQLLSRLQSGSKLFVDADWALPRRPGAAVRTLVAGMEEERSRRDTSGADVGTAFAEVGRVVAATLSALRSHNERDWSGWFVAARLPSLLAVCRITATPLPCLTGLVRSMRFSTLTAAEIDALLLQRLGEQARDGLALLRRLENCALAWQDRLDGLTKRSRAGAVAGVFLVWPALTRGHVATALGVTPPGAGVVLDILVARGILERVRFGSKVYFVAPESLGEFKLAPRQGRQIASPPAAAFAMFDEELAAFDLLARRLGSFPDLDGAD